MFPAKEYAAFVCVQVRIMFEVQDLKYATLATVSRCGMIWFSEEVMTVEMVYYNFLQRLRSVSVEPDEEQSGVSQSGAAASSAASSGGDGDGQDKELSPAMQVNFSLRCFLQTHLVFQMFLSKFVCAID